LEQAPFDLPVPSPARRPVVRLQPSRGWSLGQVSELWAYRDLLLMLAQRDIRLRYRQTALGVVWVVLQPLVAAIIFTIVFGRLVQVPSDGVPYVVFAFAGLLGWSFFASAVGRAGNSLVGQSHLVTKVYFPRILLPVASVGAAVVDLVVALPVLLVLMPVHGIWPGPQILALPLFLLFIAVLACGIGFWISALSVYYRDFSFAMPFVIQVWMYVTPVVFPASLIPERWRWVFALNPLFLGLEGIRWAAFGKGTLTLPLAASSAAVAVLICVGGLVFFRRLERRFADVI